MTKRAIIFLAEGFEEIEAITPIDVLRRAGVEVFVVSTTSSLEVAGAHQIIIKADSLFADANMDEADLLILPGGMPGTNHLNAHLGLKSIITHHLEKGKWVAAICAAPIILGDMNLLTNHTVTCYPGNEKRLVGAHVSANPVEVSLPFITARGVGAALAFSLKLVELLLNGDTAQDLANRMVVN